MTYDVIKNGADADARRKHVTFYSCPFLFIQDGMGRARFMLGCWIFNRGGLGSNSNHVLLLAIFNRDGLGPSDVYVPLLDFLLVLYVSSPRPLRTAQVYRE